MITKKYRIIRNTMKLYELQVYSQSTDKWYTAAQCQLTLELCKAEYGKILAKFGPQETSTLEIVKG